MRDLLHRFILYIHGLLNRLLVRIVDVSETNDVLKVVTKEIGLSWVDMENHVEIHNRFFIPYYLEEVKLTYYNDANQNIGFLHFEGPLKIPAYQKRLVKMPAKMSSITGLFNGVRLLVTDNIKTRTIGTSRIRFFGVSFVLPIDDIMVIDKEKIVSEELDEAEKERRRQLKAQLAIEREEKKQRRMANREERRTRKKERRERIKQERAAKAEKSKSKHAARQRLERIRKIRQAKKEEMPVVSVEDIKNGPPVTGEAAVPDPILKENPGLRKAAGSAGPGQDRSYSDPSA
jgi:flagellar biosynthesis GTPase FlhF